MLGGAAAVALLSGCGNIFEVESPGRIADDDLNTREAAEGIVTGMSYDLAQANDAVIETSSLAAEELWHSGSYNLGDIPRGIILPEDINTEWGSMMQARWVTSQGVGRLQGIMSANEFNASPLVARAYLLAGFANRLVGENVCQTVSLTQRQGEYGAPESNAAEFDRGIANFTKAIEIGGRAGSGASAIVTAAYAGRASLRAWKGDWTGAAEDAARVTSPGFVYYAILMTEGESNTIYYETHDRGEYTVFNTDFAALDVDGDGTSDDLRAPWFIVRTASGAVRRGANGSTPWYRQRKYTDAGADIPLVKGTEMLVLRAEEALRRSVPDIVAARDLMNQVRRHHGMSDLPLTATQDLATTWRTLHMERGATVWLENRRFWDLRRWFAEGSSSPAYDPFLADREQGRCIPISQNEVNANPNVP
jgi:starch-binding outer membrane protein, SusD/RagB family